MNTSTLLTESETRAANRDRLLGGYTLEGLKAAFDAVANPRDWKAPIRALVRSDRLAITLHAIEFYTSTKAIVTPLYAASSRDRAAEVSIVESIGYRAGPAGDH